MSDTLVPNWKKLMQKAWSLQLLALGGLINGLAASTPFLDWITTDTKHLFWLNLLIVGAAYVARLLQQKGLEDASD